MTVNYIPESHIRLYTTPTTGVPAEHSHYYRRLISAGYKGYVQGNVAGATLYGILGTVVGIAAGGAIALLTGVGAAAFIAAPVLGAYGVIKGADTFGKIGSNAAQLAEFAETNERRRALLDRLDETPSQEEAQEIKRLLQNDQVETQPKQFIHLKTMLIGATIGAAAFASLGFIGSEAIVDLIEKVFNKAEVPKTLIDNVKQFTPTQIVGGAAAVGGAIGSLVGLDRGWIRKWFDFSEGVVHDREYYDGLSQQRAQEIAKLHNIGKADMQAAEATQPAIFAKSHNAIVEQAAQQEQAPTSIVEAATSKEEGRASPIQYTPSV